MSRCLIQAVGSRTPSCCPRPYGWGRVRSVGSARLVGKPVGFANGVVCIDHDESELSMMVITEVFDCGTMCLSEVSTAGAVECLGPEETEMPAALEESFQWFDFSSLDPLLFVQKGFEIWITHWDEWDGLVDRCLASLGLDGLLALCLGNTTVVRIDVGVVCSLEVFPDITQDAGGDEQHSEEGGCLAVTSLCGHKSSVSEKNCGDVPNTCYLSMVIDTCVR